MKKSLIIVLVAAAVYQWTVSSPNQASSIVVEPILATAGTQSSDKSTFGSNTHSNQKLRTAFENRQSDVQVMGTGIVVKVLADDNKGSRHQKFILRVAPDQTILIAHNIDLAPRISALSKGEQVQFFGEYEWSAKGGVVHWTHHDPNGRHVGGWLKHKGKVYQ